MCVYVCVCMCVCMCVCVRMLARAPVPVHVCVCICVWITCNETTGKSLFKPLAMCCISGFPHATLCTTPQFMTSHVDARVFSGDQEAASPRDCGSAYCSPLVVGRGSRGESRPRLLGSAGHLHMQRRLDMSSSGDLSILLFQAHTQRDSCRGTGRGS